MLVSGHRSGAWLLLGAFALLGLFAMHGLGGHGTSHLGAGDGHHPASAATSTHPVEADRSDAQADPAVAHSCEGYCATTEVVVTALCVAVLAAAAAIALNLGAQRRRLAVLQEPSRPTPLGVILRSARSHDPPCLHALSVRRC